MAKAGDIKRNMVVEHENQVYIVRDVSRSAPTARGGNTLFRLRRQAIPGGQRRELTLNADESLNEADLVRRQSEISYRDGNLMVFKASENVSQTLNVADAPDDRLPY